MRAVLGIAGAFGGAATAAMGAAVGYGYMLGSVPTACTHCANTHPNQRDQQHHLANRSSARSKVASSSATAAAVDEAHRRRAYDSLAKSFDEEIEWHELFTGIKLMRWWMMRQAKGDTLEVAAGYENKNEDPSHTAPPSITITQHHLDITFPPTLPSPSPSSPPSALSQDRPQLPVLPGRHAAHSHGQLQRDGGGV